MFGNDSVLTIATATVALGMFLTALPLSSVFTDWAWLTVSIGCSLPYLVIVAALRYRGPARAWHSLVGLLASILMLLWVFVPQHLGLGILPTPGSIHDIGNLINQARQSMQAEHAPLQSTEGLRLLVASALTGLACLTDVLCILLRRPLLAAAPLLEVLAVASATSSKSANPIWFAAAAIGFLLILLTGTRLQDRAWGPSVDGTAGRLGGGRRMATAGIAAALIVPLLLPTVPTNLLARAAHHDGIGNGAGAGGQVVLSDLASLRGSLQRPNPTPLFTVQVGIGDSPFYIRQEVDDEFTNTGWRPSGTTFGAPTKLPLTRTNFPIAPASSTPTNVGAFSINAVFTILNLGGKTLPILSNPHAIQVSGGGTWNSRTASVFDVSLKRGMTYTESVQQLAPSLDQLHNAPDWTGSGDPQLDAQLRQLPPNQPAEVVDLANRLTDGLSSPFAKASAISDYFTDGKNGFIYSLTTGPDDGTNALVSFLNKKAGFCQQYASAAAVLMREAGLPARVVLGYTHQAPDAQGLITVTTADAHAWVEVYFEGIGWIPFDPTPLAGSNTTRAVVLPWATHPNSSGSSTAEPTANRGPSSVPTSQSVAAGPNQSDVTAPLVPIIVWQLGLALLGTLVLLLLALFGPQLIRRRQRRRRLDRAKLTGNPEPLWLELAATAADRDALWPDTVTVSQVADWLARRGVDKRGSDAVRVVADSIQRDRFSAHPIAHIPPDSVAALDQTLTRWARRGDHRISLLQRWLPRSLMSRRLHWHR